MRTHALKRNTVRSAVHRLAVDEVRRGIKTLAHARAMSRADWALLRKKYPDLHDELAHMAVG